jgi:hypothetical protein
MSRECNRFKSNRLRSRFSLVEHDLVGKPVSTFRIMLGACFASNARSSSLICDHKCPERNGLPGILLFRPEKTVFFDHGFETFTFD